MPVAESSPGALSHWPVYVQNDNSPWNLRRVVHLHHRVGFAATWGETQRDLESGPQESVDRVLKGQAYCSGAIENFESVARLIGDAAVASNNANRLKAWWLYRMLFAPDPFTERIALMWHNHFATSNEKVQDVAAMRRQNELFREFGRGPFGELLSRVVRDPAMLVWLDAQANRKEHPNENLARELMELFALGVGNYSETDVREGARALTGWSLTSNGSFREIDERHDDGEKTILGHTGRWRGDELLRMLLEHPATPRRLAFRICELLMGEGAADPEAVEQLAQGLRQNDLDTGWAIEIVLRSEAFFANRNIGNRVRAPVEFIIGSVRALELFNPPPSTLVLADWCAALGEDLFYPPNVFGWPGGRSWITTRSIIGRTNFANALTEGSLSNPGRPVLVHALVDKHGRSESFEEALCFLCELLTGETPAGTLREQLVLAHSQTAPSAQDKLRSMVAQILASPQTQLG